MNVAPYPLPKPPKPSKPMADNPNGEKYPFADEGITNGIREATLTGKPYPIKGWFVYSTNILYALPNPAETLKAIDALDLLVVIDTLPSEITGYADVVLPEVTFLERYEQLLVGSGRQGWMSLRQPVMPAPQEQKPNWWIAKELAKKLGIPECLPFSDIEEFLRYRVENSGMSWDELKTRRRDPRQARADLRRGRRRAQVRHAVRQGRVLERSAEGQGIRSGAEVHAVR